MLRQAAVAGYFYQGSSSRLKDQVEQFLVDKQPKIQALGIVSPHAGLVYSGSVAGAVYSSIELPDTFVLVGPNHTGLGAPVSIMTSGEWSTPLGTVSVDEDLALAIQNASRRFESDMLAHVREHSLEVQLPFIQYLKEKVRIVPIQLMDTRLETCLEVGNAIAAAISSRGKDRPLIVASSDMSHYVPSDVAKKKDHLAIRRMLELDAQGLYYTVRDEGITMCGFGPAVAMLTACKALGATKAELIKYTNSGDVSGDYDQVVGYAGVVVY
jgi:AmmeMemoRadiSam system protein B